MAVHAAQQRYVQRIGAWDRGCSERRCRVVHRDHVRAEPVRELGHAVRPPKGVVQEHEVGLHTAQRVLQRCDSERDPVPVRRDHANRANLMATTVVHLAAARHDHVMLEQPVRGGEPRFLVEIGTDPAAARTVEHRDIDEDRTSGTDVAHSRVSPHHPILTSLPQPIPTPL